MADVIWELVVVLNVAFGCFCASLWCASGRRAALISPGGRITWSDEHEPGVEPRQRLDWGEQMIRRKCCFMAERLVQQRGWTRSLGARHLILHLLLHHIVRWYYYFFPGLSKMSSPRNCFFPLARGLWAQFWWLLLHVCLQLDLCWQLCPVTECSICFRWSSNHQTTKWDAGKQGCQRWD